jgi:hypothetical protein
MVKIKTQEKLRRTVEALAETRSLIAKERAYLASLVDREAELERMIKDFFPLPIVELNEGSKRSLVKGDP